MPNRELDAIVNEMVADTHISRELILPEEISYIREHVLRKPLRVIHIWALGVGVVITGLYFGWNFGLPLGGPIGVLLATLVVCVLYLAWVLSLSEAVKLMGGWKLMQNWNFQSGVPMLFTGLCNGISCRPNLIGDPSHGRRKQDQA